MLRGVLVPRCRARTETPAMEQRTSLHLVLVNQNFPEMPEWFGVCVLQRISQGKNPVGFGEPGDFAGWANAEMCV